MPWENWVVLDSDNLLGYGAGTANAWNELAPSIEMLIEREYPEDFAKMADAIAKSAAASASPKRYTRANTSHRRRLLRFHQSSRQRLHVGYL